MHPEAEQYMRRAIELAKTACGKTSPNPMVGCVVVKDRRIISEACHEKYGEYHAERNALLRCKEDPSGADLYVTLEPCCHYGKTPPCTEIIVEKGIRRVFVGSLDSNPLVAGKGIAFLREHQIEVHTGILEEECLRMNEIFYHYISEGTPFVAMKYAMTLDGKIAAVTGDARWVTGEKAREHVHELRRKYSGILVGINTVMQDDPLLNCRIEEGVDPVRIILDSGLRFCPDGTQIGSTVDRIRTLIAYRQPVTGDTPELIHRKQRLTDRGFEVLGIPETAQTEHSTRHGVDLKELMRQLGRMKIDSVLIEGGGLVHASALEAGIVNKVYAYISPKIIMGQDAKSPVAGKGIPLMKDAICLQKVSYRELGGEILVEGYI